jgi:hypothetical protein
MLVLQYFWTFQDPWTTRLFVCVHPTVYHVRSLLNHIPPRLDGSGTNLLLIERSSLILVLSAISTIQVTCFFALTYWYLVLNFGNNLRLIIIPQCVYNISYLSRSIHASFVFTPRCSRTGAVSISTPFNTIALLTNSLPRRNWSQLYACLEIIVIVHSHTNVVSRILFNSNVS